MTQYIPLVTWCAPVIIPSNRRSICTGVSNYWLIQVWWWTTYYAAPILHSILHTYRVVPFNNSWAYQHAQCNMVPNAANAGSKRASVLVQQYWIIYMLNTMKQRWWTILTSTSIWIMYYAPADTPVLYTVSYCSLMWKCDIWMNIQAHRGIRQCILWSIHVIRSF
jgi:hypothetical protein